MLCARAMLTLTSSYIRQLQALMHAIMGVGIIGLVGKVARMDESAWFFDGSSLGTHMP